MASLIVRPANRYDIDAIVSLYGQLAEDRIESLPATELAVRIFESIAAQPGRAILVALAEDRVIGTADMLIVANLTHHGRPWAVVENVIVDRRHRRGGVGTALMSEITHRCRDAGCYKVQLLSRRDRRGAHAFYERLGFAAAAEGFRLYFDEDDGADRDA
jgi:GNAT superfamily N-acetyltransferase